MMHRVLAKAILALCLFSSIVYARSAGSPIRRTGAAIDGGQDCTACHRTNPVNTDGRGFVRIAATNYTPGQRQTIEVTISHPDAARWGFQLTARLVSDENRKAGTFSTNDRVQVNCDPSGSAPCNDAREFATHRTGSTTTGANGAATFTVEWTPPAEGAGDVVLYAAGNAANGNGANSGDYIYTTSLRLSAAGASQPPTVTSESGVSAGAFGGGRNIAPGSWIEIFGTNLSTTTREWAGGDFNGNNAPTSLDGVRVSVGGRDAFVRLVSPGQVNAQVPDGIGSGPVNVTVTNSAGTTGNIQMTAAPRVPQVLAPPSFRVNGRQLVAALFTDNTTFVGTAGEVPGVTLRPARPGETIIVYGIGFGATNPPSAAGVIAAAGANLPGVEVTIGDAPATVAFAGLSPGSIGLYQLNVVVPNVGPGDRRLGLRVEGTAITQEAFLVIGQ
ncbi:MAG: choice-of-anchor V domain-containing protein [Bryobacter sp.]|nr:choice-of-anchor V domain-containing protein [Bryobacter sp.]